MPKRTRKPDLRSLDHLPPSKRMRCAGCQEWMHKSSTSAPEGTARCKTCRGSASKHGTPGCYRLCRCDVCRAARSEYNRAYAARVRAEKGANPNTLSRRKFREENGFWPQQSVTISAGVRREVYERDGWVCQICNVPILRDYEPNSRLAPSLDHIVPQSSQVVPDHSAANLRMVHMVCNTIRWDGSKSDAEVRERVKFLMSV